MMNIYTKTGDAGDTSLYGGTRIGKDSLRVWSYGTVDEAVCALGVVAAFLQQEEIKEIVKGIQRKLFVVGAELSSDEKGILKLKERIAEEDIKHLENLIDDFTGRSAQQEAKDGFTIPGETVISAFFHTARTTVRRAERFVVALSKEESVSALLLQYLNRLSDLLYVLTIIDID